MVREISINIIMYINGRCPEPRMSVIGEVTDKIIKVVKGKLQKTR